METVMMEKVLWGIVVIIILASFALMWFTKDVYDHKKAYSNGYTQGSVDQAAVQKSFREGICK